MSPIPKTVLLRLIGRQHLLRRKRFVKPDFPINTCTVGAVKTY